jgi:hypothetical protein
MSINVGSAGLGVTVKRLGQVTFERSAGLLPMALWIGVPPLALWGLWLYRRSRALAAEPSEVAPPSALEAGVPASDVAARERQRTGVQR